MSAVCHTWPSTKICCAQILISTRLWNNPSFLSCCRFENKFPSHLPTAPSFDTFCRLAMATEIIKLFFERSVVKQSVTICFLMIKNDGWKYSCYFSWLQGHSCIVHLQWMIMEFPWEFVSVIPRIFHPLRNRSLRNPSSWLTSWTPTLLFMATFIIFHGRLVNVGWDPIRQPLYYFHPSSLFSSQFSLFHSQFVNKGYFLSYWCVHLNLLPNQRKTPSNIYDFDRRAQRHLWSASATNLSKVSYFFCLLFGEKKRGKDPPPKSMARSEQNMDLLEQNENQTKDSQETTVPNISSIRPSIRSRCNRPYQSGSILMDFFLFFRYFSNFYLYYVRVRR